MNPNEIEAKNGRETVKPSQQLDYLSRFFSRFVCMWLLFIHKAPLWLICEIGHKIVINHRNLLWINHLSRIVYPSYSIDDNRVLFIFIVVVDVVIVVAKKTKRPIRMKIKSKVIWAVVCVVSSRLLSTLNRTISVWHKPMTQTFSADWMIYSCCLFLLLFHYFHASPILKEKNSRDKRYREREKKEFFIHSVCSNWSRTEQIVFN